MTRKEVLDLISEWLDEADQVVADKAVPNQELRATLLEALRRLKERTKE